MAIFRYRDPHTGEFVGEVYIEDAVSSVNGDTGAVMINAEKVPYDPNTTHTVGSTAEAISQNASAIGNKINIDQGAVNVGKFMIVGADGKVAPTSMSVWEGGSY